MATVEQRVRWTYWSGTYCAGLVLCAAFEAVLLLVTVQAALAPRSGILPLITGGLAALVGLAMWFTAAQAWVRVVLADGVFSIHRPLRRALSFSLEGGRATVAFGDDLSLASGPTVIRDLDVSEGVRLIIGSFVRTRRTRESFARLRLHPPAGKVVQVVLPGVMNVGDLGTLTEHLPVAEEDLSA